MDAVVIEICSDGPTYDRLMVTRRGLARSDTDGTNEDAARGDRGDCLPTKPRATVTIRLDGVLVHYMMRELTVSPSYRDMFLARVRSAHDLQIVLVRPEREIIDYRWNQRTSAMAWERLELDNALSWLSTFGGAYSALGDHVSECAKMAGRISLRQLQLASRLGDPTAQARCRLFLSLSLIQTGQLRPAKRIILREFGAARGAVAADARLLRTCQGIWARLQYERGRRI